jgi:predicted DNA-binding transcriptional regulator AlpA
VIASLENTTASRAPTEQRKTREVLTEAEVSEWLGLSQPTLSRLRRTGSGPAFVRLSARRIGYRRGAVQTWLDEREQANVA